MLCCDDYLGLLCSYDVYMCITRHGSNSTHNSMGLKREGLNSGDYSLPLLPLPLSLTLFFSISAQPFISVPVAVMTTDMSTAGVHRGFLKKYGRAASILLSTVTPLQSSCKV